MNDLKIKTNNELEKFRRILRKEITKEGKLTKYGTLLILYFALAIYISLSKNDFIKIYYYGGTKII